MKRFFVLAILFLPSISWLMQTGYFPMHDDLQTMRQLQLEKCLYDWQFPCRWVPDMGYMYGYPLFNFYPPLPYYIGLAFRVFEFSFIDTSKLIGIAGFVFTAIGMYLLIKEQYGKWPGVIASFMYTYAPYHSVDFYVRGAVNEFYAMAFYPWVLWGTYRLIKQPNLKTIVTLAVLLFGIMQSHNLMLMIFVPWLGIWSIYWVIQHKSVKAIGYGVMAGLFALGLSAYFTLPVLFEQKFVHVESLTSGYFNYLQHFADIRQMFFNINWGYGASVYGPADEMSLAIGYLHWILPVLGLIYVFVRPNKYRPQMIFVFSSFLLSAFLMHWKATPLWQIIKPLEFMQFPWRLLTLVTFFSSIATGILLAAVPDRHKKLFSAVLLILILLVNANYFRPKAWWTTYTDQDWLTGRQWQKMLTSSIFDYLPKWAPLPPIHKASEDAVFLKGSGYYQTIDKKTNKLLLNVSVFSPQATIEIQKVYFPGWVIFVNGENYIFDPSEDKELGRPRVVLKSGVNMVYVVLQDTPIRRIANIISLLSLVILLGIIGKWLIQKLTQTQLKM